MPILECEKYDLLILKNGLNGKNVMSEEFVAVENLRSGLHGIVPTDSVYILPILNKPSFDLLVRINFICFHNLINYLTQFRNHLNKNLKNNIYS